MFGQQNNDGHDDQNIPEQSINGVIDDNQSTDDTTDTPTNDWQHPGTPLADDGQPAPVVTDTPAAEATEEVAVTAPEHTANELIDIKQQALQQLTPLVGHLEQAPEEKFRTTMMMIQASDDQSLVKVAYEAANAIEDEKVKAQALLDIVNEINYFTSQHSA